MPVGDSVRYPLPVGPAAVTFRTTAVTCVAGRAVRQRDHRTGATRRGRTAPSSPIPFRLSAIRIGSTGSSRAASGRSPVGRTSPRRRRRHRRPSSCSPGRARGRRGDGEVGPGVAGRRGSGSRSPVDSPERDVAAGRGGRRIRRHSDRRAVRFTTAAAASAHGHAGARSRASSTVLQSPHPSGKPRSPGTVDSRVSKTRTGSRGHVAVRARGREHAEQVGDEVDRPPADTNEIELPAPTLTMTRLAASAPAT